MAGNKLRLGVDIGGTFTDVVLLAESGAIKYTKVPSTPSHPELAVFDGVKKILTANALTPGDIAYLVHGSTVAANAVLEFKGAKTGLITTRGFRDVLEIGRIARGSRHDNAEDVLYNIAYQKPAPLVPRHLRLEVDERLNAAGGVVRALDESSVAAAIEKLKAAGIESVAICLLHSYLNPAHEERIRALFKKAMPDAWTSLSSEVLPQYREYERFSTTTLNAYVMPPLNRYLSKLEIGLRELGFNAPLYIMQANGGVMTARLARIKSVQTAFSGLVAGVLGGALVASLAGFKNAITLDIGGTSTDISLVRNGTPELTSDGRLGPYPVQFPIVSVDTIGAGGGSLARIGPDGLLKVGPQSAGADPGPVCYGKGGLQVTVTDAHVALGRISPSQKLGGDLDLNADASTDALRDHISEPMKLNVEKAADGILAIADAQIARAIRAATIERGVDPRDCVLVAYGGAGALHAISVADAIGIPTVLIPRYAGVISALGLLVADLKQEYGRTCLMLASGADLSELEVGFVQLEDRARSEMSAESDADKKVSLFRSLGVRYVGQGYELTVPISDDLSPQSFAAAINLFHRRHEELYGHATLSEPVEVVNVLVTAVVKLAPQSLLQQAIGGRPGPTAPHQVSNVICGPDGLRQSCAVYARSDLGLDTRIVGPAIVEQIDTTTFVPPAYMGKIDQFGSMIIQKQRTAVAA
jgi:N-methylhydantoinase A